MIKKLMSFVVLGAALFAGFATTPAQAKGDGYQHHVVMQVNENKKPLMNQTLTLAAKLSKHYATLGQKVRIEIVAFGPGLTMLRSDKSPVKERLASYTMEHPNVTFAACGETIKALTKRTGKVPPIIKSDQIKIVPGGFAQIVMRQEQGWSYLRP